MDNDTIVTKQRVTLYLEPSLVRRLKHDAIDHDLSLSEHAETLLSSAVNGKNLPFDSWRDVPDDYIDPLEGEKAKHRPRKPTERQLSLLGADKLRTMGYDI